MGEYRFYVDEKYTIWERRTVLIEADTYEDAVEIAIDQFKEGTLLDNESDCETLSDTMESMSVEENNGNHTEELWVDTDDDDGDYRSELLETNKPKESNALQQGRISARFVGTETTPIYRIEGLRRYFRLLERRG